MDIEHTLDQARQLEKAQQWWEALKTYLSVVEEFDRRGEDPDPGLHNRIGELRIRTGDTDEAMQAWEQAIEAYLLQGLSDSALAVCRKIVRYSPDHEEMFLRMGQIRARQGLLIYARKHFLTYAEMVGQRGNVDEAVRALEELVSWVPSDLETRLFLTERLFESGKRDKALVYLREGYWRALWEEDDEALETLRPRILELDPGADLEARPKAGPETEARSRREPTESERATEGGVWARILKEELGRRTRHGEAEDRTGPPRDEDTPAAVEAEAATEPEGTSGSDFARLLSRFKEETASRPDEREARTEHERGLAALDEGETARAITLLERALELRADFLPAFEALGRVHMERGEPQLALHKLEPALELSVPVEDDLLGVYYQLGRAHESLGNTDEARLFYERVFSIDINYRDVIARLRPLR